MPRVLVSISGGGARQIECACGMLKAMDDMGIKATDFMGASAGGVTSSLYLSFGCNSRKIESLIKTTPTSDLWSPDGWLWMPFKKSYDVYKCDGMNDVIFCNTDEGKTIPNVVVSVTRQSDAKSFLVSGYKWAVYATKAMPEIFPPETSDRDMWAHEINGQWWLLADKVDAEDELIPKGTLFVDGGVKNNVPLPPLSEITKYNHIFILLCNDGVGGASTTASLKLERCLAWVNAIMDREFQDVKEGWPGLPNITVLQPPPYDSSLLDWSTGFGLIDHAYGYATMALKNPKLQVQRIARKK